MYGILVQLTQYNEFIDNGSKNQVLTNWATTNVGLKDNQAQIRDIGVNEFLVRGGQSYYILITVGY